MSPLWRQCRRCRRVYRGKPAHMFHWRCSYCPGKIKLHGIKREQVPPLEAAWILGGIEAAQAIATPGKDYPQGLS